MSTDNAAWWQTCDDPAAMLVAVRKEWDGSEAYSIPPTGDRKLGLWVEAVARAACRDLNDPGPTLYAQDRPAAGMAAVWANAKHSRITFAEKADMLREVLGNPFRPAVVLPRDVGVVLSRGAEAYRQDDVILADWLTPDVLSLARAAYEERGRKVSRKCGTCGGEGVVRHVRKVQVDRDPPFRTDSCPGCGRKGVVEERIDDGTLDPVRLAILADALEEAGCAGDPCTACEGKGGHWRCPNCLGAWRGDVGPDCFLCGHAKLDRHDCVACLAVRRLPHPLLAHLRSPGPHVRGCWVLDLVLGLS